MPAVPKHRQPITDAAVLLFRRKGYAATGLNEIVDVSGAPKGSLYHYFPEGKASIAVAAVDEAGRRVGKTVEKLAHECHSTGRSAQGSRAAVVRLDEKVGISRRMSDHHGSAGTGAGQSLRGGGGPKCLRGPHRPAAGQAARRRLLALARQRLATLCTSALQGALIQARVERSGAPIEIAADELARMLEASCHPGISR